MTVKLVYTLTLKDFKAAQILHRRQKFTRRFSIWVWPSVAILGIIGILLSSVSHHPELFADFSALAAGALFITIWMPIGRWYCLHKAFKQLFPPTRTDPSSSLDINEERILSGVPGVSEGTILWRGILLFAQNERITMFYISELRFLFFPTNVLTPDQREELKQMAMHHGTKTYLC